MEYHSWGKVLDKNLNLRDEAKVIYGARLEYRLTDNGYVLCILTPSTTDHFKHPEEGILLDIIKEPSQLKNKSVKHWDYLVSYMLVTNVDCEPRIQDWLRVRFLRNFKRCFKNGVSQERKAIVDFGYIARWFFSVGLSGGVIFLTTIWLNSKTENDVVSQLKIVTTKLTEINDQQLNLNYELEIANNLLNSLSTTSEKIMLNGVDKAQFDKTLNDISKAINQSEIDRVLLQQKKLKITDKQ
tara:strand:- start:640 stop:1362 length:723 start_codon:yes stop_codon:yes gene_type:complete